MTKRILYGVGILIVSLMLLGLLLNYLLPLFGVSNPLSSTPILISFWAIVVVSGVFYLRNHKITFHKPHIPLSVYLLTLLPVMAVVGTELVNCNSNNIVLMVLIPLLVIVAITCMFTKIVPEKYWAFAIWMMALAVVLHRTLISPYLVGTDNILEYKCFQEVYNNGIWSNIDGWYSSYNTVLSVTILPVMISKITFISGLWVFKLIFPILLSLVPVAIYELVKTQFNNKISFLSAFTFMSVYTFFTVMLMTDKQLIASFLFAVFLLVLFDDAKYKPYLLGILGIGVILSHYSTAILFSGVFILISLCLRKKSYILVSACLAIIGVLWYKLHGNGVVANEMSYIGATITSGNTATMATSETTPAGLITRMLNEGLTYLPNSLLLLYAISQILIVVGFILTIWRWLKGSKEVRFGFIILATIFLALLMMETIPAFSNIIGLDRIYLYCMMGLIPFMFVAINKIAKRYWLIISMLFVSLFFLLNVGYINHIINKPLSNSIALDADISDNAVFNTKELDGAKWLLRTTGNPICSDNYGKYILYYLDNSEKDVKRIVDGVIEYKLYGNKIVVHPNIPQGSYIYLRKFNLLSGKLTLHYYNYSYEYTVQFPIDDLVGFKEIMDSAITVFDNGDCKVIQTTKDYLEADYEN